MMNGRIPVFRTRTRGRCRAFSGWPNVTAWIDVLFLLLIFFMLSTSFVQVTGIPVDLPELDGSATYGLEKFILSVAMSEDGPKLYFNEQEVSLESLPEKLGEIRGKTELNTIILRADQRVPHGVVAEIFSMSGRAGLEVLVAGRQQDKRTITNLEPENGRE